MTFLIVAIVGLFVLLKSNVLASFGVSLPASLQSGSPVVVPPSGVVVTSTDTAATVNAGSGFALLQANNQALNFIPVAGPALAAAATALTKVFQAASAARAKAATSENQAVSAAVPGWDQALAQIVNNYNSGQLSAAGVIQLLTAIMTNYWA